MAIKVKPVAEVAKKWADVTPGRQAYYETGALAAGDDWEKGATAAQAAFKAAISAGNIGQLFVGGIKKAGASKYTRKVKDVGTARFSQGVTAGLTDYQNGVAPMLDTIAGITLANRAPRGSASNYQRVTQIGTELNKKRLALRAAGA